MANIRGAITSGSPPLLGTLLLLGDRSRIVPERPGWAAVRSLMLVLMWISYYASLPHLQLSIAAAAFYTLPIFITLFSALIVGERVGESWLDCGRDRLRRGLFDPQTEGGRIQRLCPGAARIGSALRIGHDFDPTKCRDEHPFVLSLVLNLTFVIVGGVATLLITGLGAMDQDSFLLSQWTPMEREQWIAMILLAAAILIGSIGTAFAYQFGPSSVVGIFDFAYVGFAVIWGYIFFRETPDVLSMTGIALIALAGTLSMRQ